MLDEKKLERAAGIVSSVIALLTTLLGLIGKKKVVKRPRQNKSEKQSG